MEPQTEDQNVPSQQVFEDPVVRLISRLGRLEASEIARDLNTRRPNMGKVLQEVIWCATCHMRQAITGR